MHVMVVEDDAGLGRLAQVMLEAAGFQVTVVGHHFEELLEPGAFDTVDVVLCDLMLDEVSGLDILRAAKNSSPWVRRVVWSAVEWKANHDPGIADTALTKPSSVAALLAAVRGTDA